jgi:predicted O-linked N-acetylglucosamine transferase (SPINDLY family)
MSGTPDSPLKIAYGLHRAGDHAQAAHLYDEILRSEPKNGEALYLYGFLHFQRGDYGEAERLMGKALALNPMAADALLNRGVALIRLGRAHDAMMMFDRLLALNPAIAEAWHYRGMALSALTRHEDAVASYTNALSIRRLPQTLNNRADALFALKRYREAAEDYDALLVIDPNVRYARGSALFARLHACDWQGLERQRETLTAELRAGGRVVQPGAMLALSSSDEDQFQAAKIWVANETPPAPAPLWTGERYRNGRIRLSYVSADFNAHAVAYLIAGVLEAHDRTRFEVTAVSLAAADGSAIRARIAKACEHVIDAEALQDVEIAQTLRNRQTDIAIDMMGFTGASRMGIFARRPAPVQVCYLGYPGTTGAPYMDHLIADRVVVPEDRVAHYRERIAYLPDAYLPAETALEIAPSPSRSAAGLPDRGFVFCSFSNPYKIAPDMFGVWMNLLRIRPDSVLWLAQGTADAMRNLKREAEARGIAAQRLIFAPFAAARADHLARLGLADLALDTLPYGGHATALDALSAGVPVLTCKGTTFAGRVGASLLETLGLPELVAQSLAEYEGIAMALSADARALSALKAKLAGRRKTSALFDTVRYTRNLEAAYRAMLAQAIP